MRKIYWGVGLAVMMVLGKVSAAESSSLSTQDSGGQVTVDLSDKNVDMPEAKIEMPSGESGPSSMKDYVSGELTIRGGKVEEQQVDAPSVPAPESIYMPSETTSYMRIPTKIADTPASVQVITSQMIEDQDDFRLKDALRNVAGVATENTEGYALEYESNYIRGFSQQLYRDGTITYGTNNIDMSTVERVEVLKGPASVTYGQSEPGGIVNVITKSAQLKPHKIKAKSVVGTHGDYREYLDMGGSINKANTMAYRLNLSYVNKESFRDYVDSESFTISPAFLIKLADTSTLDLKATYTHEKRTMDNGLSFDENGRSVASIDTFLGEPNLRHMTLNDVFVSGVLSNEFLDWFTMRTKVSYHHFDNDVKAVRTRGSAPVNGMVNRIFDDSDMNLNETLVSNDFILSYDNCYLDNTFLLGVEGRARLYEYNQVMENANSIPRINIVQPVYGHGTINVTDRGVQSNDMYWVSPYAQNKLVLFDDLVHISLAGRIDNLWTSDNKLTDIRTKSFKSALTGNAGVLINLLPHFSPYGTISNSFIPQSSSRMDVNGNVIDPETGFQIEGGFKSGFYDDKLLFTAAAYQITKENVSMGDPDNPGYAINGGRLRSQGFEFTLQGEVYSGWDVCATYAYTDTDVLRSDTLREGSRFRGIPVNSGSLWVTHRHEDGFFKGLRYGAGAYFVDKRLGDNDGTFYLPGYITGDLMVGYKRELIKKSALNVQLNIHNLWNQEYYESSMSKVRVMPGAPFGGTLSVGLEF